MAYTPPARRVDPSHKRPCPLRFVPCFALIVCGTLSAVTASGCGNAAATSPKSNESKILHLIHSNTQTTAPGSPDEECCHFMMRKLDRSDTASVMLYPNGKARFGLLTTGLWSFLAGDSFFEGSWAVSGNNVLFVFPDSTEKRREFLTRMGFETSFPQTGPFGELHANLTVTEVLDRELRLSSGVSCEAVAKFK